MPITKSAKKALRSSGRKHVFNLRRKEAMRRITKEVEKLAMEGKNADASMKLALVYKAIDKAAKRGIIKKNTAARKKSRIARILGAKK
ncbi:MAG: small subunit ribosomal protein S20 [Parcubacteria group bacterium Gr01-1014_48]|nr:MAG: small subunit ribosomal protein S20 [Parcubacteria group bacterium Greene0416_14]TSC73987.1 MAG: small subunit ribosomal protein S20 [Parcubacteria group bacterium Gr01-1014_48]TSD00458.1 MAG: small subunit ribosomal protein S20 [Parcubacteria group bacterium Greene1014_15]TSD07868.1 MAG: small subunit ribosomal protein S20 [Parcubacteria group bacterium Greene0714_4]